MVSTSFHAKSLEELSTSPIQQRTRRRASRENKVTESPSNTPLLKGKASAADLMFEMSDGEEEETSKPVRIPPPRFTESQASQLPVESPETSWPMNRFKEHSPVSGSIRQGDSFPLLGASAPKEDRTTTKPWGTAIVEGTKLDLKDIMSQEAGDQPSNLTLGLSQQSKEPPGPPT